MIGAESDGPACLNSPHAEAMRVRGAAGLDQASFENVDRSRGAAVIVEIDVASAGPPEEPRIEPILGAEGLVPSLARTRRDEAAERACLGDCASPSQATNTLVTANRMFVRVLRAVVRDYVASDEEVDEEIVELRRILAASGASAK